MFPPPVDLPNLRPSAVGDQRRGQRVHGGAVDPADQLDPADDVAPLVGAADLQPAAVPPVELQVVLALQQQVAELGVGHAVRREPSLDGLARQHDVDREVLADVAQELQRGLAAGPVEVVRDERAGRRAVELHEPLELAPDPVGPLGDGRDAVERALARVARIADHPGGAAREHDRPGARLLEPAQREQRDEVARVQAGRGRVEPAVEREHARGQVAPQCVGVGALRDEAAPLQFVEDVRAHATDPPPTRSRRPARRGGTGSPPRDVRRSRTATACRAPRRRPPAGPCAHGPGPTGHAAAQPHPGRRVGEVEPVVRAVRARAAPPGAPDPGRGPRRAGRSAAGRARRRGRRRPRPRAAAPRPARRRAGSSRWRRSASRTRSRRTGAPAARTSPRCAGCGRGSCATPGRRHRGTPPPRRGAPRPCLPGCRPPACSRAAGRPR